MEIEQKKKEEIMDIWGIPENSEFLDITPFGDFFVKNTEERVFLYSLTDGEVKDVTELVEEYGLPPASIDLGREWYQFDAQGGLEKEGYFLDSDQCFGFKQPIFLGGDYGPENIEVVNIPSYNRAIYKIYQQVKNDPTGTTYNKVKHESE